MIDVLATPRYSHQEERQRDPGDRPRADREQEGRQHRRRRQRGLQLVDPAREVEHEAVESAQRDAVDGIGRDHLGEAETQQKKSRHGKGNRRPHPGARQIARQPEHKGQQKQGLEVERVALEQRGRGRGRERTGLDQHPEHCRRDDGEERPLGRGRRDTPNRQPEQHDQRTHGDEPDHQPELREVLHRPARGRDDRVMGLGERLVRTEPARERRSADHELVEDVQERAAHEQRSGRPEPPEPRGQLVPRRPRPGVEAELQQHGRRDDQ